MSISFTSNHKLKINISEKCGMFDKPLTRRLTDRSQIEASYEDWGVQSGPDWT